MKKILLTCLAAACILAICACQKQPSGELDTTNPYFTGKVIEIEERGCLMEVTNTGNGNFYLFDNQFAFHNSAMTLYVYLNFYLFKHFQIIILFHPLCSCILLVPNLL